MALDFFTKLSNRTGLSEELVRRVFKSGTDIIVEELVANEGYDTPMPGIGSFYYKTSPAFQPGGEIKDKVLVRVTPSSAIARRIEKVLSKGVEEEVQEDKTYMLNYSDGSNIVLPSVRVEQIEALR